MSFTAAPEASVMLVPLVAVKSVPASSNTVQVDIHITCIIGSSKDRLVCNSSVKSGGLTYRLLMNLQSPSTRTIDVHDVVGAVEIQCSDNKCITIIINRWGACLCS